MNIIEVKPKTMKYCVNCGDNHFEESERCNLCQNDIEDGDFE